MQSKYEKEPDRLHVVFFDEITNALPSIQGIAFNIVLDREVNGIWQLPENARIVAAGNDIKNAVILLANIDSKELNGHYDGVDFFPPKWMSEILGTNASKILIIDKIDSVSKEEQLKFCELLEHRKISTFSLPENCVILVTANEVNKNKISKEIYSLVAQI